MKDGLQVVLITGGASGIGLHISQGLLEAGYFVLIADNDRDAIQESTKSLSAISDNFRYLEVNLSDWKAIEEIFLDIENLEIDILVNNVNFRSSLEFDSENESSWNQTLNVTLRSAFRLVQLIFMQKRISNQCFYVINIGSILGNFHGAQSPSYHVAKGGLESLTKYLAIELPSRGFQVTSNYLELGFLVQNRNLDKFLDEQNSEYRELAELHLPNGEVGKEEDVLQLVKYLISGNANFVNGVTITLDGGASVQEHFNLVRKLS